MQGKKEYAILLKEIVQAEIMSAIGMNLDASRIKELAIKYTTRCAVMLAVKTFVLNI